MKSRFGYTVGASLARSGSGGGIVVAFRMTDKQFLMEQFKTRGFDVFSIVIVSGQWSYGLIGASILPTTRGQADYLSTIQKLEVAANSMVENGFQYFLLGDQSTKLNRVANESSALSTQLTLLFEPSAARLHPLAAPSLASRKLLLSP